MCQRHMEKGREVNKEEYSEHSSVPVWMILEAWQEIVLLLHSQTRSHFLFVFD